MKWLGVIILVIVGVVAAFFAIEYLTVSIHQLPSFVPGHKNINGHYRKRGAIAAVIAVAAFAAAGYLAYKTTKAGDGSESATPQPTAPPATASADLLMPETPAVEESTTAPKDGPATA